MTGSDLYSQARLAAPGCKIWWELSDEERSVWERAAKAVQDARQDGYEDGFAEGVCS